MWPVSVGGDATAVGCAVSSADPNLPVDDVWVSGRAVKIRVTHVVTLGANRKQKHAPSSSTKFEFTLLHSLAQCVQDCLP
jgi:hypothetical protein